MRLTQQLFYDSVAYFVSTGTPKSIFRSHHHYQGFRFFRIRELKINYTKAFITFDPIIYHSSYLPQFNFDSHQIYYRCKPVYALQPQQILPLKKQCNLERFELKYINENCHTFCRLQFIYTKLVSMIE